MYESKSCFDYARFFHASFDSTIHHIVINDNGLMNEVLNVMTFRHSALLSAFTFVQFDVIHCATIHLTWYSFEIIHSIHNVTGN